jgi:transcriptional regulator with XRE-family HTH domain
MQPPGEDQNRVIVRCWNCRARQFLRLDHRCAKCGIRIPSADRLKPAPVRSGPDGRDLAHQVGDRLRELRNWRGLSQRQMARSMNRPRQYVSRVERGASTPSIRLLELCAQALDVKAAEIVGAIATPAPAEADPFWPELRRLLLRVSAEDRKIIADAARDMARGQYPFDDWIAV